MSSRPARAAAPAHADARLPASLRYDDIAVGFHWLIAILIFGQLIVGKYMTSLPEADAVRFGLTQWHKTFGILVLLLATLRLAWRFTHAPPPEPDTVPRWQQLAAHAAHIGLYVLLFAVPLTGWILVSWSSFNVDTYLFDVIPWPHLPTPAFAADGGVSEGALHSWHEIAGNILILILIAHVGAALKHHFVDKDTVLRRMLPTWSRSWNAKLASFGVAVAAAGTGLFLYAAQTDEAALLAAGDSEVSFVALVTGDETPGTFPVSEVEATLDETTPENSSIVARVETGGVTSPNVQMSGSLPDTEWFDSESHPEATFTSTSVTRTDETTLGVDGTLVIKGNAVDVSFPMVLADEGDKRVARGEFTVDRQDFGLGLESQKTDQYVGFPVVIRFRFDIGVADPAA